MEYVTIARLTELCDGEARTFEVDGFRALLARIGARVYALQARCPHKGCDWSGARLDGDILFCPRCHYRYSARTGLNPLTSACHVNQSTAECHYRNFPEGRADVYDVRLEDDRVLVATAARPFVKSYV